MITKEVRESLKSELLAKSLESAKMLGVVPSMNNFVTNLLLCEALRSNDDLAELGFAEGMNVIYEVRRELHFDHGFGYLLCE